MRIHVSIPGTVESYCVDERGEKRKATDELWLETYLCSVLRAYSYADDGNMVVYPSLSRQPLDPRWANASPYLLPLIARRLLHEVY